MAMPIDWTRTVLKKQSLKNTSMHVHHTKKGLQRTTISLKVKINKFSELKDGVIYSRSLLSCKNWLMNFLKKDKAVTLTLKNINGYRHQLFFCYIWYDRNTWDVVLTEVNKDDEYIVKLSSAIIHAPQNKYIESDVLLLELYIPLYFTDDILRLVTERKVLRKGKSIFSINDIEETEEVAFMKNITSVFYDRDFTDFKINNNGFGAFVNKSIIAARSKYFFDYLNKNPDSQKIEIDASDDALSIVLYYMYFGRLFVDSMSVMKEVMELAEKLQMKKLCELTYIVLQTFGGNYA